MTNEAEAAPAAGTRVYPFAFTGEAREYFRIWIVNLFLSLVTLGLYSPWAKVRKKRYLHGNTWVADANFDYHGNPLAILKGRLVAVLALLAYNFAGHYLPRLGTAIILVLMVAAPWLIMRSLKFNAVNSSYRNLRFDFHGHYAEGLRAIAPFLLWPALALALPVVEPGQAPRTAAEMAALVLPTLPIALFYPYVIGAIKRYQVRRSAYGASGFDFSGRIRSFYGIYLLAGLLFTVCLVAFGAAAASLVLVPSVGWVSIPVFYLLVGSIVFAFTRSRVANLAFNATTVEGRVRFVSTLKARRLAWIYFVNLLAIAASFGLAVPWAVMRTMHYRASCLRLECEGDLEGFAGAEARAVGATGEQLGEFFDVDLSL